MKLSQKNTIRIIIAAIMLLYNVVLFLIMGDRLKTSIFWISYGFIMLMPVLFLLLTFIPLSFTSGTRLVLSLPAYRVILTYGGVEFVIGTIFMFCQRVVLRRPGFVKVSLLVQIPVLIIFTIMFFVMVLGANHVSKNYAAQKQDVYVLGQLYAKVSAIAAKVSSPAVASALNETAEKIKYSDFNRYAELKELDDDINNTVSALRISLDDEEMGMKLAKKLDLLIDERNEGIKQLKKLRG
ncbi:MAG: hypothetical protein IJX38_06165 [Clostridia bacterium]|nr:hypothetical protein [Clostridia bacterium]